MTEKRTKELSYIEKVWHTVAIVAFVAVLILIARVAFSVVLLSLADALLPSIFMVWVTSFSENQIEATDLHDHLYRRLFYYPWCAALVYGQQD